MIYTVMAWYGYLVTVAIIVSGLTFAYLYHTRTGGKWRDTNLGRNLMYFVLAPTGVLMTALVPLRQAWWTLFSLGVYTTVPIVYIQRIRLFLRVQREEEELEPDSDHRLDRPDRSVHQSDHR